MAGDDPPPRNMFSQPEPGFDKDDPDGKKMVADFYKPENRPRHTLDPRGERSAPLRERIQERLDEFERAIKRKPTTEEAGRITEVMASCSGWLEGLKIDAAGKKEIPMAVFNRLVDDYAGTIQWVARDRTHFDAKYTKMVLERDDKIKLLESRLEDTDPERQERIDNLINEVTTVKQANKTLENDNKVVHSEIAHLKKQIATLTQANRRLQLDKQDLSNQVSKCKTKREGLESQLNTEIAARAKLQDANRALGDARDTLARNVKNLKNSMEAQDEENKRLRQERDDLWQRVNELLDREADLQRRLRDCEDRGRRLQTEVDDAQSRPEASGQDAGGGPSMDPDDLQRQIDDLTERIGSMSLQNDNLSSLLLTARDDAESLQRRLAAAETDVADAKQKRDKLQLALKATGLQKEIKTARREAKAIGRRLVALKRDTESARRGIESLTAKAKVPEGDKNTTADQPRTRTRRPRGVKRSRAGSGEGASARGHHSTVVIETVGRALGRCAELRSFVEMAIGSLEIKGALL